MTGLAWPLSCAAVAAAVCARWNWWRPLAQGLPVLMYHKVGEPPPGSKLKKLSVGAEEFRWQMDYLLRHGYTPLLFSEMHEILEGRSPAPAKPALVTFDDGYANNAEIAFPILREIGVKANIFLVHDTLGKHNVWHDPETEAWIRMMTLDQVRELQASGLIGFGSHTMTHRSLAQIPLEEARWEMCESKKRLEEKLGHEVMFFAYPYGAGACVPEVREAARAAGYRYDFAIRQGMAPWPWKPDLGPIPRLFIRRDDNRFDFHLNMTRGKARF
ncbi:MAG: polysaccharide deacetylase family protein [Elusimicrobia bacterium]|nr:polysaccharide deacetylase family protein [Elusimicrobiota bacterium]